MKKRRLYWYVNVTRRHKERILRRVLSTDLAGKRKRWRPETRWKDACQLYLKSTALRLARKRTGRCGEGRSAVILPATCMIGKARGKKTNMYEGEGCLCRSTWVGMANSENIETKCFATSLEANITQTRVSIAMTSGPKRRRKIQWIILLQYCITQRRTLFDGPWY